MEKYRTPTLLNEANRIITIKVARDLGLIRAVTNSEGENVIYNKMVNFYSELISLSRHSIFTAIGWNEFKKLYDDPTHVEAASRYFTIVMDNAITLETTLNLIEKDGYKTLVNETIRSIENIKRSDMISEDVAARIDATNANDPIRLFVYLSMESITGIIYSSVTGVPNDGN